VRADVCVPVLTASESANPYKFLADIVRFSRYDRATIMTYTKKPSLRDAACGIARRAIVESMEARQLLSTGPQPFTPPTEYAPGTIEAEDFDKGGEGVAFHNPVSGNGGKVYRPDNIAIAATTDPGGGYYVGSTKTGEWINYTVNVSNNTKYTFDLRVRALAGGGAFHVSVDKVNRSGTINVPAVGWKSWTTISTAAISLTAGKHVVRLVIDRTPAGAASAVDFNWMRLRDNPLTSPRTQAWRDDKYGMLVHLGLYSMLGGFYNGQPTPRYGETIMWDMQIPIPTYDALAGQFNPVNFNANDYITLAKAAGMKYIVFVAKHHDGFSLYNSVVSSFNVMNTPFGRDPLREMENACRAAGIGFGIDYSILDWQHPELAPYTSGATDPNDPRVKAYINNQLKPQLRELIANYNPDILWFDGEWKSWWTRESGRELEAFCRSIKPTLIINNRVGKRTNADGDFDTPEQTLLGTGDPGRPWETDMSLNGTFGYRSDDTNWKSPATVIQTLMSAVSWGGNFMLNVGPDGTGTIPPASISIIEQAGQWVNANASAIYGTTMSPLQSATWGNLTRKGNTLYVIVFKWPTAGKLHLNISGPLLNAKLLVGGQAVPFTSGPTGIDLTLPTTMPQQPATVIQLDFSGAMSKVG
jgi:alpha-L-fucosidase